MKYTSTTSQRPAADDYMDKEDAYREDRERYQEDALYARVRTSGSTESYVIDGHRRDVRRRRPAQRAPQVDPLLRERDGDHLRRRAFRVQAPRGRRDESMVEALELFEEICENKVFSDAGISVILFLNKRDLFREKIVCDIAATPAFADYAGGRTTTRLRVLHCQVCAAQRARRPRRIPSRDVRDRHAQRAVVMGSCRDIILKANMASTGLM